MRLCYQTVKFSSGTSSSSLALLAPSKLVQEVPGDVTGYFGKWSQKHLYIYQSKREVLQDGNVLERGRERESKCLVLHKQQGAG